MLTEDEEIMEEEPQELKEPEAEEAEKELTDPEREGYEGKK